MNKTNQTLFSVGTSFTPGFAESLSKWPVGEIYGRMEDDGFGGGRHRFLVPKVSWKKFSAHVGETRKAGISFNYLVNSIAPGSANVSDPRVYRRFRSLLSKIEDVGVDWITVSSPYLLKIIKNHSSLRVRISVFARISNERQIRQWLEEGADRVVLDSMLVNRNPDLLASFTRTFPGDSLELFVNNRCELDCAFASCHAVDMGHASRQLVPIPDACYFHCQTSFLNDPVRYVTQDWIRPEDLHLYESLGYHWFKIAGRGCSAEVLLRRVRAYVERRYDGNLLDLLGRGSVHLDTRTALATGFIGGIRMMLGLRKAAKAANIFEEEVYIENRALDGFLDRVFRKGGCFSGKCHRCNMCRKTAFAAVKFPNDAPGKSSGFKERLVTGSWAG